MLRAILTSIFFALAANVISCGPAPRNSPEEERAPADLAIVCGQGGGFTGMWEGHTVQPDGTVLAWQGRGPEENPQPAGTLSAEQKLALWKKIQAIRFFEIKSDERGNMTSYMKVTAGSKVHEVYWVPRFSETASPLQELYVLCQETVSHAAGLVK